MEPEVDTRDQYTLGAASCCDMRHMHSHMYSLHHPQRLKGFLASQHSPAVDRRLSAALSAWRKTSVLTTMKGAETNQAPTCFLHHSLRC